MRLIVGVDLGGTSIVVGTVTEDGHGLHGLISEPTPVQAGPDGVVDRMVAMVQRSIALARRELGSPALEVAGVGVGAPGPLDTARGLVLLAPNLGWADMPLRDRIAAATGLHVTLDNDANCATFGEWWRGAAQGGHVVAGFTIGTGIGGGIVLNGQIYHGASDGAGIERVYGPLATRIRTMPVPVIAAVNGVAAGAGANFALCCDFVVAARSAGFIQAFSKIGLVPDCGGTWLLPRLIGRARALGYAMTGDKMPAEEAERIGMIWKCVDEAELMSSALALAERLATMPSRALAETRRVLDAAMPMDFAEAISLEADTQRRLGHAGGFAEGVAAFLAKRSPRFSDR